MIYIIGIDPGLCSTGWAVIDSHNQQDITLVDHGLIKTTTQLDMASRLNLIYVELSAVFKKYSATRGSIEKTLVNVNAHSSIDLAMAKSIVLLLFAQYTIKYNEYAPTNVKKIITGNGKADKEQLSRMIKYYIKSFDITKISHHECDALAIALCEVFSSSYQKAY